MIDIKDLFLAGLSVGVTVLGYFLRERDAHLKALQLGFSELSLDIVERYATKAYVAEAMGKMEKVIQQQNDAIFEMLRNVNSNIEKIADRLDRYEERIDQKLDRKADK